MGHHELAPRAPSGRSGENVNPSGAGDTVPRPLGLPGGGLGRESGPEQEARGGSPPPVRGRGRVGEEGSPQPGAVTRATSSLPTGMCGSSPPWALLLLFIH